MTKASGADIWSVVLGKFIANLRAISSLCTMMTTNLTYISGGNNQTTIGTGKITERIVPL